MTDHALQTVSPAMLQIATGGNRAVPMRQARVGGGGGPGGGAGRGLDKVLEPIAEAAAEEARFVPPARAPYRMPAE